MRLLSCIEPDPSCRVCGQQTLQVDPQDCLDYLSRQVFRLAFCPACGCYETLTPQAQPAAEYYGAAYYGSAKGKFSRWLEWIFRANHRRNARAFYDRFQPRRVLEIGCGRAYILRELKHFGSEVYCLESAGAADWILQNPDVNVVGLKPEELAAWPFPSEHFQLVIFWHVFEHIDDPVAALKQATAALETGQTLCISVPNISSFQARLTKNLWFHLDVPRHLFHFSRPGLHDLLEKQGYEIVKVESGDAIQNLYGWFQSLANLVTPSSPNLLYRFLQGSSPWRSAPRKLLLLLQILSAVLWLPLGLLGYLAEELTGRYGTMTFYARKK